jgi:hypothetical protein
VHSRYTRSRSAQRLLWALAVLPLLLPLAVAWSTVM